MIKTNFFKKAFLTGMLVLLVGNVVAQTTLTLKASDATNSSSGYINWQDSLSASGPDCSGGYWNQTYLNNTGFIIGDFKLTHDSGEDEYSYWGGFTTGSNGNSGEYGAACNIVPCYADSTHTGSLDWVCNQWGVMAGGGLDDDDDVVKGNPYLIAYWNYFMDNFYGNPSLKINLTDNSLFNPQEVYICNHPWPYYGNIKGDGFARPLNQPGDRFDLIIHAVKINRTDSIVVNLARYDSVSPSSPIQSYEWEPVDLSALGDSVQYLYFTMFSTDEYPGYGPNTAVYFCMDKLTVNKLNGTTAPNKAIRQAKAQSVTVTKIEVADKMELKSYTGGTVTVYNTKHNIVLETRIKAGGDSIDLSKLPAGDYRVRHGHKVIPITKIIKQGGKQ